MSKLETRVVYNKPNEKAEAAVIWLHGLGADYNDFIPIVDELKLPVSVKFVFPNAPIIPVTINGGMMMRAWYDITNFSDLHREVDSSGIVTSVAKIEGLIEGLIAEGFDEKQIILAGFSQGGVLTYYAGLMSKYNLAGIMVLSGYLPDLSLLDVANLQHKSNLPILICHGSQDPVVGVSYARLATQSLQQFGIKYEWYEYPMAHSVCYEEVLQISKWMLQILRP